MENPLTLEDRLQGEWLCCVDEQCLEEAWSIDIRGQQCNFDRTVGALEFFDDEARLAFGNGDRFVINRLWMREPPDHDNEIPVVIESDRGLLQSGWMFRPNMAATS